jgi:negative regulator of flagellin synthesis FlgM
MNVNNNLQGLQQLLASQNVTQTAGRTGASNGPDGKAGTDEATLSSAASVAAAAAPDSDVRMDKVTAIQQAVAGGTYNVPTSEVAGKMIDFMLGR